MGIKNLTKLTLSIGDDSVSWETTHNDCSALEIVEALKNVKAIGVLEKDISFGNEGTVYTNVNSALHKAKLDVVSSNYIAGLGGRNIEKHQIEDIFTRLQSLNHEIVFVGLKEE